MSYANRQQNRQTGKRYENVALSYLQKAGLKYVAANVSYTVGELDLIMQDGLIWVFVEVRYRRSAAYGGAVWSITQRKRQRLLQAANRWLMEKNLSVDNVDCRFDVFAITGNKVEWIQNAFNDDAVYY